MAADTEVDAVTDQVQNLQLNTVEINYADEKVAKVPQVDMLKELLMGDHDAKPVVFFGEGNFTFSVAFASMRGSWDGITATRYQPFSPDHPEPELQFTNVKLMNMRYCIENGKEFKDSSAEILGKVNKVLRLENPPARTRQFHIDATAIPAHLDVQRKVAWFQCPWTVWTYNVKAVCLLISGFLTQMEKKQACGDYALIGIVNLFPFVKTYYLQTLLGDKLVDRQVNGYQFLGADTIMTKEILQHGYKHKGYNEIHFKIIRDHVTLVFRKTPID